MAKTTTWTGATDLSRYFTPTNWTNGVPGPGDTEIIPLGMPTATNPHLVGQTVNLTASPAGNSNVLFTVVGRGLAMSAFDAAMVVNGGDNQIELNGQVASEGTIFNTNLTLADLSGGTGVASIGSTFRNYGTITYNVAARAAGRCSAARRSPSAPGIAP